MQSRFVTGLLTGHKTLSRHLYVMWLSSNTTCRNCGTCVSVRSWPYWDVRKWVPSFWTLSMVWMELWGHSGTLAKEQGPFKHVPDYGAQRACFKVQVQQDQKGLNPNTILFYFVINIINKSHYILCHLCLQYVFQHYPPILRLLSRESSQ